MKLKGRMYDFKDNDTGEPFWGVCFKDNETGSLKCFKDTATTVIYFTLNETTVTFVSKIMPLP